jgi:hypothetical protein
MTTPTKGDEMDEQLKQVEENAKAAEVKAKAAADAGHEELKAREKTVGRSVKKTFADFKTQ